MAQNKGAIVRYRAIDKCLRSKHGRYGWEELAQACSEALFDAVSERMTVSRRQIFLDLNHMEGMSLYSIYQYCHLFGWYSYHLLEGYFRLME